MYGLRRFDSMPLALGNVTVNNKNKMYFRSSGFLMPHIIQAPIAP